MKTTEQPQGFILGKGEPYNSGARHVDKQGRPLTVWSALRLAPMAWYSRMTAELWQLSARLAPMLLAESVLDKIVNETNRCTPKSGWVEVWIDAKGKYRWRVWRRRGRAG